MLGIDCATKLTASTAQALKNQGVKAVGRYLGGNYGLTTAEVKAIHDAGLLLWLIFELAGTKASYFNYGQGVLDVKLALAKAQELGAPKGICIYFAVDFDAQPGDMAEIKEYLHGAHTVLTGKYLVGVYGSYFVIVAAKGADYPPDKYFQTLAWSYGNKAPNHIYQATNNTPLAGISVDVDYINDDAGLWGPSGTYQIETVKESVEEMDHAVIYFTDTDFSSARIVSRKLGNCAMYCRDGNNANIHPDIKNCKHPVIVGGSEYHDNPNATNCCGEHAEDTAIKAAQYAQTL